MRPRFTLPSARRLSSLEKLPFSVLSKIRALPERIRNECSYSDRKGEPAVTLPVVVLGELETLDDPTAPAMIALSEIEYFLKAAPSNTPKAFLWVRVDPPSALHLFSEQPFFCTGVVAEHSPTLFSKLPLFSVVKLTLSSTNKLPTITSVDTRFVPELTFDLPSDRTPGDVLYGRGEYAEQLGEIEQALSLYVEAGKYDHSRAYLAVLRLQQRISAPLRAKYPEIFEYMDAGEPLRALTHLRRAAESDEQVLPILAYALRGAGCPTEGLSACERTLQSNPFQPDVLGHKWSYLTALGEDETAFHVARDHLALFPNDPLAMKNALDSSLLLRRLDDSFVLNARYASVSENLELMLREEFKLAEHTGHFTEAIDKFRRTLALVAAPTAELLSLYGELLNETGEFEESVDIFNQALMLEPSNGRVLLGYARTLARADRESEAEQFLRTCLQDKNRLDRIQERVFLITLLAEILRRTGRAQEALDIFDAWFEGDLVQLSTTVGPLPALEKIESLYESGKIDAAKETIARLSQIWPDDPFVEELSQIIATS